MVAVRCENLWMIYRSLFSEKVAIKDVNLKIPRGKIYGLLGPNGAGKTTLVSIMATLLRQTKGKVEVLNLDNLIDSKEIRKRINIASGNPNLIWSLTVYENLRYYAMLYGIYDRRIVENLIKEFELQEFRDVEFNKLSTGNKQKLILARAFVNNPELVFLDEPTKGLDPPIAKRLREKISSMQRDLGITVILTTHYMGEAEMLCERIAFINRGEIVAEGTKNDLKRMLKMRDKIRIEVDSEIPQSKLNIEGVYMVEKDANQYYFYVDSVERRLWEIAKEVSKFAKIKNIAVREVDLEDVFNELAK
ncbi:MAG: ABC transporter ATP-binding protein [Archaeoglobaceae archaeon]|nr:ABC transporter ATP-binding protein [Archaeoglobaceae archaeon]MDW7990082.1 ABC transporter ATP-binding protein [Archaeoglobaceae archaeon]